MNKFNRHYKLGNGFDAHKTIRDDLKEELDKFTYPSVRQFFSRFE